MTFPKDFIWGVGTSSYQIEGASLADGRGECIWHRFSHNGGNVVNDHHGDIACDHYHRYLDDIRLMQDLGLDAYRFSISWPRILPAGTGDVNEQGLDFYDRLVDSLLEHDILPFVTLYHWDLPQALQYRGGWQNRDIVSWFTDYTDIVTRHLGDRVKHWVTINEPLVVAFVGHAWGHHAPGLKDHKAAYVVAHHTLLAHASSVPVIRQNVPNAEVGIVLDQEFYQPFNDQMSEEAHFMDGEQNRWFLDPVFRGHYPDDIIAAYEDTLLTDIDLSEASLMNVPLDFHGLNYYRRRIIGDASERGPLTSLGWEVYPEGMYHILMRLHEDYHAPRIFITENGAAFPDHLTENGEIDDQDRVAYLAGHFEAARRAIEDGVNLAGYFVWSLIDNFEWAYGYTQRFGIVHVDFDTLQRTPKQSAIFYRDFIQAQRT